MWVHGLMPIFKNFYIILAMIFIVAFVLSDPTYGSKRKILILGGVSLVLVWLERPEWYLWAIWYVRTAFGI